MTQIIPRESAWKPSDDWLYVESRALKKKLQGVTVTATNYAVPREVPVGFIEPDFEVRSASYPGIYLTYGDVRRAPEREHRGPVALQYAPPGYPVNVQVPADMDNKDSATTVAWNTTGFDPDTSPYRLVETPIPYDFVFRIAVLTRNYQQAFEIAAQLSAENRLHERWAYLEVPEDGTIRTLELTSGPEISVIRDEDKKRLVQTLYSVRVAAELNTLMQGATQAELRRVSTINTVQKVIPTKK